METTIMSYIGTTLGKKDTLKVLGPISGALLLGSLGSG